MGLVQRNESPEQAPAYDNKIYKPLFERNGVAERPISNVHTVVFDTPVEDNGDLLTEADIVHNFFTKMLSPLVAEVHTGTRVKITRLIRQVETEELDKKAHPFAQFYPKYTWAITEILSQPQTAQRNSEPPISGPQVRQADQDDLPIVLQG